MRMSSCLRQMRLGRIFTALFFTSSKLESSVMLHWRWYLPHIRCMYRSEDSAADKCVGSWLWILARVWKPQNTSWIWDISRDARFFFFPYLGSLQLKWKHLKYWQSESGSTWLWAYPTCLLRSSHSWSLITVQFWLLVASFFSIYFHPQFYLHVCILCCFARFFSANRISGTNLTSIILQRKKEKKPRWLCSTADQRVKKERDEANFMILA